VLINNVFLHGACIRAFAKAIARRPRARKAGVARSKPFVLNDV